MAEIPLARCAQRLSGDSEFGVDGDVSVDGVSHRSQLSEACRSLFPRLPTRMVNSKSPFHLRVIFLGLAGLFFVSAAFADQPKKEVHSQADLPRVIYPVTGSVSALLQSDGLRVRRCRQESDHRS